MVGFDRPRCRTLVVSGRFLSHAAEKKTLGDNAFLYQRYPCPLPLSTLQLSRSVQTLLAVSLACSQRPLPGAGTGGIPVYFGQHTVTPRKYQCKPHDCSASGGSGLGWRCRRGGGLLLSKKPDGSWPTRFRHDDSAKFREMSTVRLCHGPAESAPALAQWIVWSAQG